MIMIKVKLKFRESKNRSEKSPSGPPNLVLKKIGILLDVRILCLCFEDTQFLDRSF